MALAININDLLSKQKIESNRIELRRVGIQRVYTIVYVRSLTILMILEVVT